MMVACICSPISLPGTPVAMLAEAPGLDWLPICSGPLESCSFAVSWLWVLSGLSSAMGPVCGLQSQGWEKLNKALEETVSDEKALPLFEDAANRFLEVTATGELGQCWRWLRPWRCALHPACSPCCC